MQSLMQYINERTSGTKPLHWFMVTGEFRNLVLERAWFRKPCSYPYKVTTIENKPCFLFPEQHGTITGYNPNPVVNSHHVSDFYLFFLANNLEVYGHVSDAGTNDLYITDSEACDQLLKLYNVTQPPETTHPCQNDDSWLRQAFQHRQSVLEKRQQTLLQIHHNRSSDPQQNSPYLI